MHLPLQSGADSVLRRMARRCKTAEFAALTERARRVQPDINITTDIIVGFPGETENEWEESLRFIEAMDFGHIHIFTYSPREGTKAATLPDPVPEPLKKARARLARSRRGVQAPRFSRFLGREFPVLWENGQDVLEDGGQLFFGYTPNYLRIGTVAPAGAPLSNSLSWVRLDAVAPTGDFIQVQPPIDQNARA